MRHNADRLTQGVREFLMGGADGLPESLVCPTGVVSNDTDSLRDVILQSLLVGLACAILRLVLLRFLGCYGQRITVIPRVYRGEDLPISLNEVCQAEKQRASVRSGELLPRRVSKCLVGCLYGLVNIVSARRLYYGDWGLRAGEPVSC